MSDDNVIKLGGKSRSKLKEKDSAKSRRRNKTTGDDAGSSQNVCCSFCGRSSDEVLRMVKGPGVNICSECTMIAVQYLILEDKILSSDAQKILDMFWHVKD